MRGKERPSTRPVRLLSPGPNNPGRAYGQSPSAASVIPFTFTRLRSLCATTGWAVGYRRHRRRPTPGAEAFVGLFAGDELPPGIATPSLPFLLCETDNPNPSLSYLAI